METTQGLFGNKFGRLGGAVFTLFGLVVILDAIWSNRIEHLDYMPWIALTAFIGALITLLGMSFLGLSFRGPSTVGTDTEAAVFALCMAPAISLAAALIAYISMAYFGSNWSWFKDGTIEIPLIIGGGLEFVAYMIPLRIELR